MKKKNIKEKKKEQYKMSSIRAITLSGKEMALAETLINSGVAKDFSDLVKKGLYFISTEFNLINSKKEFRDAQKKLLWEIVDLMERGEHKKAKIKKLEFEINGMLFENYKK